MPSPELSRSFEWPEKPVDLQLQHAVEQFYYREAQLLDTQEYETWLTLLSEDIHYWMPLRTTHTTRSRKLEYSGPHDNAHFDDDYESIRARVRGRVSGLNWTEDPPSRSRHMINNVIVREVDANGVLEVGSAFLCYRNRQERMMDIFVGERRDILRPADNGFGYVISKRTILLDQSTILSNNISLFF
ncbi:3-phenylpropionate/cinnamic acid dioxygenase subunit beta [Pseudomonas aeruginosa]|uniref:3-phenylpropionate/cinnamic acid dioxygenase subunit beta n=1 Tax=Pseudomonas TaxID=286 RepID=UPI0015574506|nr:MULTISPECIES: 3-phenylpropionate/cinnamic acid dioxygenase subunit beta [Pseudomonas]MCK2119933.1 3-phenylpropionate/cinnamic acid dioxygenase subunit beta [Pseudomonas sp. PNPG3]HCF1525229.1 3-phenylpropionate/cinnamic acid dioxygenase subunit beta [Pseudomonas aeruginosa]HEP8861224.1 3-phenylpropionate/cinnamic acid dioxygenase subunit beta [Pseudomonas aeruginosa]